MIFGMGIDIAKCSRFEKWILRPGLLERFFNAKEIPSAGRALTAAQRSALSQRCAARFAAKEAFSKALGTGIVFDLRDAFIQSEESGKPRLVLEGTALKAFRERCPQWQDASILVSLSHEKEFACACVIIEV